MEDPAIIETQLVPDVPVTPVISVVPDVPVTVEYPTISQAINLLGLEFEKKHMRTDLAFDCYKLAHKRGLILGTYNYAHFLTNVIRKKHAGCLYWLGYDGSQDPENQAIITEINEIKKEIDYIDRKVLKLFLKYTQECPTDTSGWYELGEAYGTLSESLVGEYLTHSALFDNRLSDYKQKQMNAFEKAIELGDYRIVIRLLSYYGRTNESILGIERCKEISNKISDIVYQSIISDDKKGIPQKLSKHIITKLSVAYSTANGQYLVSTNETRSLDLNIIAVKLGSVEALYNLGMHYFNGQGTSRNYDIAFKYFLESAEKGDKDGQREVAIFYNLGLHTNTKDYAKAKEWFQKAAAQYDYESCVTLLRWSSDLNIPHSDDLREPKIQSELLLKIIESLKRKLWPNPKKEPPTTLSIPVTLLQYWGELINDEIPKLNRKIIELECRPPTEGGSLYKMAAKEFEHFTNI